MTIQVAVAGCSSIARAYIRYIARLKGVDVVAAYSRSYSRAGQFAADHGIPYYTNSIEEFLGRPGLDAVFICTEPGRHVDIANRCIQAGKHFFVEKPLDDDLSAAKELLLAAEKFDHVAAMCAPYRYDIAIQAFREHLGNLDLTGGHAHLHIKMPRSDRYYQQSEWKNSSSVFANQAIHWFDVCNWIFGEPVQVVAETGTSRSFLECADNGVAIVHYPRMVRMLVSATTAGSGNDEVDFTVYSAGQKTSLFDFERKTKWPRFYGKVKSRLFGCHGRGANRFLLNILDFIEAIRFRRQTQARIEHGYQALRLVKLIENQNEKTVL